MIRSSLEVPTETEVRTDPEGLSPRATRLIRRQRVVLVIAVIAALVSTTGLVASTWVKSPAQRVAEQSAPPPSVLTASVQRKILRSSVAVRGTVASAWSVRVDSAKPADASVAVLSGIPKQVGDLVRAGNVVAEVSGRPIIALPGAVPSYRDLARGDRGPDVRELQTALRKLGYWIGDTQGAFGADTARAIKALYRVRHYAPSMIAGSVGLPRSEVVFVPAFPAVVGSLAGQQGTVLTDGSGPLMVLLSGAMLIRSTVPSGQQQLIRRGQHVQISDETYGRTARGVVASLGAFTAGGDTIAATAEPAGGANPQSGTGSAGPPPVAGYPLIVTPTSPLDRGWLQASVALTITTAATRGPVLVVPAAAINTSADGTVSVRVQAKDGIQRRVPVRTGAIASGEVEVTPTGGQHLAVNNLVVTGQ